ncbi:hypothetical protein KP509_16G043600 [Ceratopteris richardii]|uniref:Uncharacterized protein n=1 Tax=Ceratopteris richardii TaxID=49495 RepID=A0A8T2SYD8_CERRI|nr:hypothetical protein KP509_16G043600 [Ceratopteris richardii]
MSTETDTTHSLCSPKANLLEQDVVDVKSSMIQTDAITEGQSQRQDESSSCFLKSKASTGAQPQKQAKQCKTASLSNRQRALKKKEVLGMTQIWVKKGVQPSMLPQGLPPNQIDHDYRRTKHLRQGQARRIHQIWVPKLSMKADHNQVQIWVPKKLATAKQGRLQMWVPKKLLHVQRPMLPTMRNASTKKPRKAKGKNRAQRPKEAKLNPSTKKGRHSPRIWVWKPKAQATSTEPRGQPHWIPKFGLHPKKNWPEVISTVPNPIPKWVPIRRITSFRDPIDTSNQRIHQVYK